MSVREVRQEGEENPFQGCMIPMQTSGVGFAVLLNYAGKNVKQCQTHMCGNIAGAFRDTHFKDFWKDVGIMLHIVISAANPFQRCRRGGLPAPQARKIFNAAGPGNLERRRPGKF